MIRSDSTELSVAVDGTASLAHVARSGSAKWRGRVFDGVCDRLWEALARAGFPAVPPQRLVGGARLRVLEAEVGAAVGVAAVEYHAAARLPGYAEAFALLDAIVDQLAQGTVRPVPAGAEVVVADSRRE